MKKADGGGSVSTSGRSTFVVVLRVPVLLRFGLSVLLVATVAVGGIVGDLTGVPAHAQLVGASQVVSGQPSSTVRAVAVPPTSTIPSFPSTLPWSTLSPGSTRSNTTLTNPTPSSTKLTPSSTKVTNLSGPTGSTTTSSSFLKQWSGSSSTLPTKTVPNVVVRKGVSTLGSERVFAGGAFRFSVPPRTLNPKTLERTARKLANRGIKSPEKLRPEVFFALFTTASPAKRGADGVVRPIFCKRPVWVVRFAKVSGSRQSGVVIPRNNKTATTMDLSVMTEIVVIIDDATAAEVRRSEYRPESRLPTPSNVVVCPRPEAPTTTKRLPIRAVRELRFRVRSSFVLRSKS